MQKSHLVTKISKFDINKLQGLKIKKKIVPLYLV